MGSETDLIRRLGKAGFNSWHCKKAVVEHMVRKSQMTRGWILSRALRFGRGQYRLHIHHENVDRKKYLGIPKYLIKQVVVESLKVGYTKLLGDDAWFFEKCWQLSYLLGEVIEARLIHKELQSNSAVQGFSSRSERLTNPIPNAWNASKAFRR